MLLNRNRALGHMLSNNGLCLHVAAVCVTIFSTGSKFRPVSDFTELHALTLAAHSHIGVRGLYLDTTHGHHTLTNRIAENMTIICTLD